MHKSLRTSRALRGITTAAVTCLLIVGVSSCGKVAGKVAEKSVEKATGAKDVNIDDDGFSVKTEDGEFSTKVGKDLPANWPSDILPVADGFQIDGSQQTKVDDGEMNSVTTSGDADPGALIDFYVEKLEAAGADVGMQTKTDDGGMVMAEKDGTNYQAMISHDGGKTSAVLNVMSDSSPDD